MCCVSVFALWSVVSSVKLGNTTFHIVHYINSAIQKGGVILGVRRSNQGQIWGPIKKTVTAVVWSYEPRNLYMTKIEWSV